MSKTAQISKSDLAIPRWQIDVDYVETCNCDVGCPCNFSGFPTYGFCRALVFQRTKKGWYGDTKLDGLSVISAFSWPKAIHQGDGTAQFYVDKRADNRQRKALQEIFSGKAKGNGYFAIFATTYKYVLEPQFVDIKYKIDGKKSWFAVPGVIEAKLEPFRDPVSGEESVTEIHNKNGFIWKTAEAAKTSVMRIVSPNLSFDDSGQNAFYCGTLTFKGP